MSDPFTGKACQGKKKTIKTQCKLDLVNCLLKKDFHFTCQSIDSIVAIELIATLIALDCQPRPTTSHGGDDEMSVQQTASAIQFQSINQSIHSIDHPVEKFQHYSVSGNNQSVSRSNGLKKLCRLCEPNKRVKSY